MGNLLCWFGFHAWQLMPVSTGAIRREILSIRQCSTCGARQLKKRHTFGWHKGLSAQELAYHAERRKD